MRIFVLLSILSAGLALGQRPAMLTPLQAEQKEVALRSNPGDMKARAALLEFYFRGPGSPSVKIPARRAHILWLIQNAPTDPLASSTYATIDPAGHSLADPEGFKLASAAWREQLKKQPSNLAVLLGAAYFFKLSDKAFTLELLKNAQVLYPNDPRPASALGDQYANAILGVTMVNGNGYPLKADPTLIQGPLAQGARAAVEASKNPRLLAMAAYTITFEGAILLGARMIPFDAGPLGDAWADRAVALAPGDREIAAMRDAQRELRAAQKR